MKLMTQIHLFVAIASAGSASFGMEQNMEPKIQGEEKSHNIPSLKDLCLKKIGNNSDLFKQAEKDGIFAGTLPVELRYPAFTKSDFMQNPGNVLLKSICEDETLPKVLFTLDNETRELVRKTLFKMFVLPHITVPPVEYAINMQMQLENKGNLGLCELPLKLLTINTGWSLESLCFGLALQTLEKTFLDLAFPDKNSNPDMAQIRENIAQHVKYLKKQLNNINVVMDKYTTDSLTPFNKRQIKHLLRFLLHVQNPSMFLTCSRSIIRH